MTPDTNDLLSSGWDDNPLGRVRAIDSEREAAALFDFDDDGNVTTAEPAKRGIGNNPTDEELAAEKAQAAKEAAAKRQAEAALSKLIEDGEQEPEERSGDGADNADPDGRGSADSGDKKAPAPKKRETDGDDGDDGDDATDDPLRIFAEEFAKRGLIELPEEEDFELNDDSFVELFASRVKADVDEQVEAYKASFKSGEAKELLEHLEQGGNVRDFMEAYSTPDYKNLNVEGDDNKPSQRRAVRDWLRVKGFDEDQIDEELALYEESDVLEKRATQARAGLIQHQEQQREELRVRREQEAQAREEARVKVISDVEATLEKTEEVRGIPIPRNKKKALFDYMTKADKKITYPDGRVQNVTGFQYDEYQNGNNIEDLVARAYLRMTGFDLSTLKSKTKTEATKELRDRLGRVTRNTDSKSKTSKSSSQGGDRDPWGEFVNNQ